VEKVRGVLEQLRGGTLHDLFEGACFVSGDAVPRLRLAPSNTTIHMKLKSVLFNAKDPRVYNILTQSKITQRNNHPLRQIQPHSEITQN
jgi:hypothetical protein